jgi:hypothetical protein
MEHIYGSGKPGGIDASKSSSIMIHYDLYDRRVTESLKRPSVRVPFALLSTEKSIRQLNPNLLWETADGVV